MDSAANEVKGNFHRINPRAGNGGSIGLSSNRYSTIFLLQQPNVSSDIRIKYFVESIPLELQERFFELEPKKFVQYGKVHFGYIAQDVERILYKYTLNKYGYEQAQLAWEQYALLLKDESYLSLL